MALALLKMRRDVYGLRLLQGPPTGKHEGWLRSRATVSENRKFLAKLTTGASCGLHCRICASKTYTYPNATWKSSDEVPPQRGLRSPYGINSRIGFLFAQGDFKWLASIPGQISHRFHSWPARAFQANYIPIDHTYYPTGNTPATFLLQSLPPEQDANVLLLGSGDPRNILFTAYNVQDDESRRVDFTCCDMQPAILARNIILLSLLVDDRDCGYSQQYWNIFYHFLIDNDSLSLIQEQAQKLIDLSATIDVWHESIYGSVLRMVSKNTLSQLRSFWAKYSKTADPHKRQDLNTKFRDGWLGGKSISKYRRGSGQQNITGMRSAGPLSPFSNTCAILHYEKFWDTGVAGGNSSDLALAKNPNPMFLYTSAGDEFIVHDGTDPVLGFHLEMAYTGVVENGPLGKASNKSMSRAKSRQQLVDHLVQVVKVQFKEWSKAFARMAKRQKLIVRFHVGDALRFCRAVAICRKVGVEASSFDYAQSWRAAPLKLDGGDYEGPSTFPAPMNFDVVDTSNLSDHVGLLNLLIATTPILSSRSSSVLYTETFYGSNENQILELPHMLCGDVVTMSLLLGLAPVGYVTGTIPGSSAQESINFSGKGRQHIRMSWKQPILGDEMALKYLNGLDQPRCKFVPEELAMVLFQIYHKIFETENLSEWRKRASQPENQQYTIASQLYIRETYAEFLGLVQKRVDTDWSDVIEILRKKIVMDQHLDIDARFKVIDLFFHLHQSGVYSIKGISRDWIFAELLSCLNPFWPKYPMPTATIALTVPRSKLTTFVNIKSARKLPPPTLCAVIDHTHIFSSVQTIFGKLICSKDGLSATIAEDIDDWRGTANLIVSFSVPTSILLGNPNKVVVAFYLAPTALNALFLESAGLSSAPETLLIYETVLSNLSKVAVFRNPPGISCLRPVIRSPPPSPPLPKNPDVKISNVMVFFDNAQVEKFRTRIDISLNTPERKALLRSNELSVIQASPCTLGILIPKCGFHVAVFPYPVDASRAELRVFPDSFSQYIELSVPPSRPADMAGFNLSMLPIVNQEPPVVWDMPRVNLDRLPILDTEIHGNTDEWLPVHLTCMYSDAERLSRDQKDIASLKSNLKDSLASILLNSSGNVSLGRKTRVFAISSPTQDKFQILIFVTNLRIDLGSRTVVADARVLPLTESIAFSEAKALVSLHAKNVAQLSVEDAELKCWRNILPTLVERCRNWKHTTSCEYREQGIPASKKDGESPLCSCGVGKAPQKFSEVEEWRPFEKYWTRVAIAPIFAFPYAESSSMTLKDLKNFKGALKNPLDLMRDRQVSGIDRSLSTIDKKALGKDGKTLKTGVKALGMDGKAAGVAGTTKPQSVSGACHNCKRKLYTGTLVCKSCGKVQYCSAACRKRDWKRHKKVCKE